VCVLVGAGHEGPARRAGSPPWPADFSPLISSPRDGSPSPPRRTGPPRTGRRRAPTPAPFLALPRVRLTRSAPVEHHRRKVPPDLASSAGPGDGGREHGREGALCRLLDRPGSAADCPRIAWLRACLTGRLFRQTLGVSSGSGAFDSIDRTGRRRTMSNPIVNPLASASRPESTR
jgi:hypothetical protein